MPSSALGTFTNTKMMSNQTILLYELPTPANQIEPIRKRYEAIGYTVEFLATEIPGAEASRTSAIQNHRLREDASKRV